MISKYDSTMVHDCLCNTGIGESHTARLYPHKLIQEPERMIYHGPYLFQSTRPIIPCKPSCPLIYNSPVSFHLKAFAMEYCPGTEHVTDTESSSHRDQFLDSPEADPANHRF